MTTQADKTQDSNNEQEQVKFLPLSKQYNDGRRIPPATLAVGEVDGTTLYAIWYGGHGTSHNDPDAEFMAIAKEPQSLDDVIAIAVQEAILAALGGEAWYAPTETLRAKGFTFYTLLPAAQADVLVA